MFKSASHPDINKALDAILASGGEIRVAQFGGRGGMPSGYSPGGNKGMQQQNSGPSFNDFQTDAGFDARLELARKPVPEDPDRNMEKRLESKHQFGEQDQIPYELTMGERKRLKLRQQIRRREQLVSETTQRDLENTPSFIHEKYKPKPCQMMTMENQLAARRIHQDDNSSREKFEELPERIYPTRRHMMSNSVLFNLKLARILQDGDPQDIFSGTRSEHSNPEGELASATETVFDNSTTNPNEKDDAIGDKHKTPSPYPRAEETQTQTEVMNGLTEDAKSDYDGFAGKMLDFDNPTEDEIGDNNPAPWAPLPNASATMDGKLDSILDGDMTKEDQLAYGRDDDGKLKTERPQRVQDLDSTRGWKDRFRRPLMEDMGDNDQPIADWVGMLDDPKYQGGDPMGIGNVPRPGF